MSEEGFFARRVFFERKENGDAVFRLSYPLRLAPLDTSPFQKGRHVGGGFATLPLTIRGGMWVEASHHFPLP